MLGASTVPRLVHRQDNGGAMRRRIAWALALSALVVVPSAGSWSWPVQGQVVQPFVFDEAHPYAGGQRRGIDIAAAAGSPVLAPVGGTVTFAGSVPSSGATISILSGSYSVTLTQLASLGVAKGQTVAEGATVATAAAAVHLGVRVASDPQGYVDPMLFLPAPAGDASAADGGAAPVRADASGAAEAEAGSDVPVDGASAEPVATGDAAAATNDAGQVDAAPGAASDGVEVGTTDPAAATSSGPATGNPAGTDGAGAQAPANDTSPATAAGGEASSSGASDA